VLSFGQIFPLKKGVGVKEQFFSSIYKREIRDEHKVLVETLAIWRFFGSLGVCYYKAGKVGRGGMGDRTIYQFDKRLKMYNDIIRDKSPQEIDTNGCKTS